MFKKNLFFFTLFSAHREWDTCYNIYIYILYYIYIIDITNLVWRIPWSPRASKWRQKTLLSETMPPSFSFFLFVPLSQYLTGKLTGKLGNVIYLKHPKSCMVFEVSGNVDAGWSRCGCEKWVSMISMTICLMILIYLNQCIHMYTS